MEGAAEIPQPTRQKGERGQTETPKGTGQKGRRREEGNCGTAAVPQFTGQKKGAAGITQATDKRLRTHAKRSVFARD